MANRNAAGQNFNNNSDGWYLSGGVTPRKMTLATGDVSISGTGSFVYTFPGLTCYLSAVTVPTTVTGNTSVTFTNLQPQILLADATSGAFTITLPTAVSIAGAEIIIVKVNSGTNNITVATTSSQTINGYSSITIDFQYKVTQFVSNGSNWIIVDNISDLPLSLLNPSSNQTLYAGTSTSTVRSYTIQSGKKLIIESGSRFRIL